MTLSHETRKAIEFCKHDLAEQATAVIADGMCPLCLADKLKACVKALVWYADGNDEFNIVEAKDNSFLCTMEEFSSRAKAALEKVKGCGEYHYE